MTEQPTNERKTYDNITTHHNQPVRNRVCAMGNQGGLAMKSIFDQMKAAGVKIASHETDLYVPVNEVTRAIVGTYEHKSNVTTFTNQVEGGQWYDIPFAYTPAWEAKWEARRKATQ